MNRVCLILGAAFVAVSCQTTETEPSIPAPGPDGTDPGMVTRVNDGDSGLVQIDGLEIEFRLDGINAPELGECFGLESSDRLESLIAGAAVGVESTGTDRFGRTLVYLWLDEAPVNLEIVSGGHAVATTPDDGDDYGTALLTAEDDAASSGRGLWSGSACGGSGPIPDIAVDPVSSRFDPDGRDEEVLEDEWVTFEAGGTLDVSGWTIRDESSAHRCLLPDGTLIPVGQPLTVTSADPCWDPGGTPVWNNGGDLVLLQDQSGRIAARHRFTG